MLNSNFLPMRQQFRFQGLREHREAIFIVLAFPDDDFISREVEILDAQAERFEKPESGTIKQLRDEVIGSGQLPAEPKKKP